MGLQRKAITPVISIIVLLLITVALAGASWSYISGYWEGMTSKQLEVSDSFCLATGEGKILIKNMGSSAIISDEIIVVDKKSGNDITGEITWSSEAVKTGLVLELNFDDQTDPGKDTSGQGNNGTLNGPTWTSSGKVGGALEFDGIDDYIDIGNYPSLNITDEISIEAWFKLNEVKPGDFHIASKGSYGLFMSNGKVAGHASVKNNNNLLWSKIYNFSSGYDIPQAVAIDRENNVIVVGAEALPGSDYQWRIMKFDSDGNSLWNNTVNPSDGFDSASGVAIDSSNNIIVGGHDEIPGDKQFRIMKFDSDGNSLWNYTLNTTNLGNEVWKLTVDSNDNIITVGWDQLVPFPAFDYQWSILKLDSDGNQLWDYTNDFSGNYDVAYQIAVDRNDNFIAVGVDRIPGNMQWRIMKFDTNKNLLWNKFYDFWVGDHDRAYEVDVDSNDNIIVSGYDTGPGDEQFRIMKFDSNGNSLWNYTVNPNTTGLWEWIDGMAVDSNDNIVVLGKEDVSRPNYQLLIMKLDSNKNSLWNYTVNVFVGGDDWPNDMDIDSNDNFVVVSGPYTTDYFGSQWDIRKFGNLVKGKTALSTNRWYLGTFTYDGSTTRIYLDGVLQTSIPLTGNIQSSVWNLSLGAKGGKSYKYGKKFPIGSGNNFNGTIDEVRIYNTTIMSNTVTIHPGKTATFTHTCKVGKRCDYKILHGGVSRIAIVVC